jgi:hypothetical protein
MGRLSAITIDKAEQLENWIEKLAEETNGKLIGAEFSKVNLITREPFTHDNKKYFTGFVAIDFKFDKKDPDFLTEKDKEMWYSKVREIAQEKFGIYEKDLSYMGIPFHESSEEELYILTPNKEAKIREGFDKARRFVEWYYSAVIEYEPKVVGAHSLAFGEYLTGLEYD